MSYLRKLQRAAKKLQREMKPGEVRHITVVHEDNCPRLKGGPCVCDAEVRDGMPPQIARQVRNARNN